MPEAPKQDDSQSESVRTQVVTGGSTRRKNPKWMKLAVVAAFAVIGGVTLVLTHASTPGGSIADAAGYCIMPKGSHLKSGTKVELTQCNGSDQQNWVATAGSNGAGTIATQGYCLTLKGDTPQTHLRVYPCDTTSSQKWYSGQQWKVNSDGTIVNLAANLCVTNDRGRERNGNGIQADTCSGDASQHWIVNTTSTPPQPQVSCDSLTVAQAGSGAAAGTETFNVVTTTVPGVSVNNYVYNFGDKSANLTSVQSSVSHTYKPGSYTASVSVNFNESGKVVSITSPACSVRVTVAQPSGGNSGGGTSGGNNGGSNGGSGSTGGTGTLDSFFSPAFTGSSFCHFSKQNYTISNNVLTAYYPAGSTAPSMGAPYGGLQDCLPSSLGAQPTLALTYKIRFPVGFQFVKGGKLPGLYGGAEPFSGGSHNQNGWSMRLMWRAGGAGEVYSYTAKTSGYGDEYGKGNFYWQADGQWHTVTERVTINSPGASNGSVTLAYDGKQVINQTGIDVTNKNVGVGGLFFSTFYGGHDPSWSPSQNESIDFSGFSISK